MTRGELLERMTSRELSEWQAFSAYESIGERRADLRAAMIASTIANVNRDQEKRKEPFPLGMFMVQLDDDEQDALDESEGRLELGMLLSAWGAPVDIEGQPVDPNAPED